MRKVYKSKVAKWYLWTCIGVVAAFIGTLFLCYQSTWVLLIDVVFIGIAVALMFDILFPALSAKRIGIRYGLKNWIYISPKDQEDFISDLKSINPLITIS